MTNLRLHVRRSYFYVYGQIDNWVYLRHSHVKGLLKHDEYETIMNAKSPMDLDDIIDRMLRGDFIVKRGETYH